MRGGLSLYDMTDSIAAIRGILADTDIAMADPDMVAEMERMLDIHLSTDLPAKSDGYVSVIRELEATGKALKAEETRLKDRRKAMDNAVRRMKDRLLEAMTRLGEERLDGVTNTVWIATTEAVEIVIEDAIPEEYWKVERKVSKSAIKAALKEDGSSVPGAVLTAPKHVRTR